MRFVERPVGRQESAQGGAAPAVPSANAATAFTVSDVKVAAEPLPELPCRQAVTEFLGGSIESCSSYRGQLVAKVRSHPLIGALHAAFSTHRPIALSPDIIWLTLTQGFAHHINANAERLRHGLVGHDGKLTISVRRDDFVKGSPENPWPEVFAAFSAAIREHIGPAHGLIVADFSTTGPVERAASEVTLLDSMQAFFGYEFSTLCGIPSITLEGTVQDWQAIAHRVQEFSRSDLAWWVEPLKPILEQFVAAAGGDVDRQFWDSIYKWQGLRSSGSPYVSAWITSFFPYLDNFERSLRRNPWLGASGSQGGPGRDDFPSLPAKAPFLWKYPGMSYDMGFIGGLIGIRQEPQTLRLRPEIGWAVREAKAGSGQSKPDPWASSESF